MFSDRSKLAQTTFAHSSVSTVVNLADSVCLCVDRGDASHDRCGSCESFPVEHADVVEGEAEVWC